MSIDDNNYSSSNEYKVELQANEPLSIDVDTLAPDFFSNSAEFRYVDPYFSPYIIEE